MEAVGNFIGLFLLAFIAICALLCLFLVVWVKLFRCQCHSIFSSYHEWVKPVDLNHKPIDRFRYCTHCKIHQIHGDRVEEKDYVAALTHYLSEQKQQMESDSTNQKEGSVLGKVMRSRHY